MVVLEELRAAAAIVLVVMVAKGCFQLTWGTQGGSDVVGGGSDGAALEESVS